jgi:hypothetical protein
VNYLEFLDDFIEEYSDTMAALNLFQIGQQAS